MSEAEPTHTNSASLNEPAASAPSEVTRQPAASAQLASEFSLADADSVVAAGEGATKPAAEAPKAEAPAPAPEIETDAKPAKAETPEPEPACIPGKVIVMSPRDSGFAGHKAASESDAAGGNSVLGKRRIAAVAAMITVAAISGAIGGAMATAAFMQGGAEPVAVNDHRGAFEASLARMDADLQALKTGLEHTSKLGMNQFNKTSDRLERLERAQAEPAAKLARLTEAVDKLRATATAVPATASVAPAAAPAAAAPATPAASVVASAAPAATREATGSVPAASSPPMPAAQAATAPPKTEVARLPTLEDWVLRDVDRGSAWIGNRRGVYEVFAGDVIPGLGRIDAIRRQDGRWVVVTSKGLIVAR